MACLWVQTAGFGVCESLCKIRREIFLTLKSKKKTIKIWFLMTQCTFFRKQNNTKTPLSEVKMFASQNNESVWEKNASKLMSLSFCSNDHKRIDPNPLPFECFFSPFFFLFFEGGGMCICDTDMAELDMDISYNIDSCASTVERCGPWFAEFK